MLGEGDTLIVLGKPQSLKALEAGLQTRMSTS